jgi:hypothetical protein
MNLKTTAGVAGLALALAAGSASAVTIERKPMQNATGLCDALIPSADSKLRRGPTYIKNIATEELSVIVACSAPGDDYATGLLQFFAYFRNDSTITRTISCTMYAGSTYYGVTTSTKSVALAPGELYYLSWLPNTEFPAAAFQGNVQCSLPRGTSIHEVGYKYRENVGA